MTMTYDQIVSATEAALDRRDQRRDILAAKITEIAKEGMRAARVPKLTVGEYVLEWRVPVAYCSQWADDSRGAHRRGKPVLLVVCGDDVRSLGPAPDLSHFDGRNMQHMQSPARDAEWGCVIHPATVAQLREIARGLPAVVAELLAAAQGRAESESREAEEALAAL